MTDPLVGRLVDDRYRVVAKLARGGMATVYEAVDLRLERTVALKVMHPGLAEDADFVARFVREARSAARLSHPNVVAMYDQGSDGELVFLAMEYVPSLNLREVLRERGRLSVTEALDVIEPVVSALSAAHTAGIVHRDIKPENVLLAQDGRVMVADFGLARATSNATSSTTQGVLIGTVAYLAPEQVERGITDPRSDVYAAGIVLFEMLTGAPPFAGETPMSVAYQHVNGVVPPPSELVDGIPRPVDALLAGATERDPDGRYADASRFLNALRATRHRLGLPAWSVATATAGGSLNDTLVVPRRSAGAAPVAGAGIAAGTAGAGVASTGGASAAQHNTTALPRGEADGLDTTDDSDQGPTGPVPTAQRRKRRRRGVLALLVVLLLAIGVGAFAFNAGAARYVDVPPVAKLTQDQAGAKLRAAGLTPVAGPKVFSETVAKGAVISTNPRGGDRAKDGSDVEMTISKGPERYEVPKLKNVSEAEAKTLIKDQNLSVGKVKPDWSSSVKKGEVISSDPATGTSLKKSAVVALVVSKGPQPIKVPKVTGDPQDAAVAEIRKVGLVPKITERKRSETVPSGVVISQSPGGGTVDRGSTINLVISTGPPPVVVPDVVGKSYNDAVGQLTALGFKVAQRKPLGVVVINRVQSQSVTPNTSQPKGSTITLSVV